MEYGVIILAGGKSSRMGTNKALIPVQGATSIRRIRDEIRKGVPGIEIAFDDMPVAPFIIVTNDPDPYQFLGERTVRDRYPGLGPLSGIHAGLESSSCDWNLVVACDMPMVTAEAARFLLEEAVASNVDAVVPFIDGQLHPLFAAYHKRCADQIEHMLNAGQLRMHDLLNRLHVRRVTEADFPDEVDTKRVFYNMNRPEEWQQVQVWLDIDGRDSE
ncbi:molybdenum cofactor guanylyltransferase [Effusibacillus consociatus]|uniref:Probable molybdenum cofactor guanylyltransferase n=1 Tax=Effusibacillus consociatus TaxID=1117041 RepID=A0ABV9Q9I6_9BACL